MGELTYTAITSLDGYIADDKGNFDWGVPDEEVHSFINELQRPVGTYLYGRKLYDMMAVWEDSEAFTQEPAYIQEFAKIWQAADKVVFSTTLRVVSSAKTQLETKLSPEFVRQMKRESDKELSIGGAGLSSQALRTGIVVLLAGTAARIGIFISKALPAKPYFPPVLLGFALLLVLFTAFNKAALISLVLFLSSACAAGTLIGMLSYDRAFEPGFLRIAGLTVFMVSAKLVGPALTRRLGGRARQLVILYGVYMAGLAAMAFWVDGTRVMYAWLIAGLFLFWLVCALWIVGLDRETPRPSVVQTASRLSVIILNFLFLAEALISRQFAG